MNNSQIFKLKWVHPPILAGTMWLFWAVVIENKGYAGADDFCSLMVGVTMLGASVFSFTRCDRQSGILYTLEALVSWLAFQGIALMQTEMLMTFLAGFSIAGFMSLFMDKLVKGDSK